jgi:hypothetical protein
VWSAVYVHVVGSFDDAIRQHLDLKRRQGADPRVVADLEREVFGGEVEARESLLALNGRAPLESGRAATDWPGDGHYAARRSGLSQETVEIDMDAYINASRIEGQHEYRAYDWSTDAGIPDISDPASSFEWETPSSRCRLSLSSGR